MTNDLFTPPFSHMELLSKRRRIRRELLKQNTEFLDKRIAVLGGSTTHDILDMLELFLLHEGIRPTFYEGGYARFWEEAVFPNPVLEAFAPDVIYVFTTIRNLPGFPELRDAPEDVDRRLEDTFRHFTRMWESLETRYGCPVIQNNFEYPFWRLQGSREASDIHGRVHFVTRLNLLFAEYARTHSGFYLHDLNYLSASYGLERWSEPFYWYMYKYALALPAVPVLAHSVSRIIKSLYGKNKKAFALDLDNTLWGGVVGDDGPENLQTGQETPAGQAYSEFQDYLKAHEQLGVPLNVISKNDPENAMAGLQRPDMRLKPEDFITILANWNPKADNLAELARTLSLTPDSFVFVDDNPAEQEIVRQRFPGAGIPVMGDKPEEYIRVLDRMGWFEVTELSGDDGSRVQMYRDNLARSRQEAAFGTYEDYLRSLEMRGEFAPFSPLYVSRIAQLTNKSNQFNLTTRRYTPAEIQAMADDEKYLTLYGRLADKFGDNGVVSVIAGEKDGDRLNLFLWLMSCRVLKRDMELAMMDALAEQCARQGIRKIIGHYYPTKKNQMVKDFYQTLGFSPLSRDPDGHTVWELDISRGYEQKNHVIRRDTE